MYIPSLGNWDHPSHRTFSFTVFTSAFLGSTLAVITTTSQIPLPLVQVTPGHSWPTMYAAVYNLRELKEIIHKTVSPHVWQLIHQ